MKKIYAITGGASGMGLAAAEQLGKRGAVLIGGRTEAKIEKAIEALKKKEIEAYGQVCDVSDRDSTVEFARRAAVLGSVAGVINAAGISPEMGEPEPILRINMLGTINAVEAFYPLMEAGSAMVNISSMMGHTQPMTAELDDIFSFTAKEELLSQTLALDPDPVAAYSLSKRFVLEYSCRNVTRFARKGARIVTISPGVFETPLLSSTEDPAIVMTVKMTPLQRMGQPEEIGEIIDFIMSEKGTFFTGCDFRIDGGFTAAQMHPQL